MFRVWRKWCSIPFRKKGDDTTPFIRYSFIHDYRERERRKAFNKKKRSIIMEASGGDDANDDDALGVVSRYALFQTLCLLLFCVVVCIF